MRNINYNQNQGFKAFKMQNYNHNISIEKVKSPSIQITQYASINSPKVQKKASIEVILRAIKNGDENRALIEIARVFGKRTDEYDKIKTSQLPTFRFNFMLKDYAKNDNITAATGLIYLDADDVDSIPDNDYVFAKWKSLSNTGYGILVKVDNLTPANHKAVYNLLSEIIGITSDAGARKAIQQTVQSYDSNLYHNPNSKVFHFIENKKKVSSIPIIKEKECIGTDDTLYIRDSGEIRFNNIDEYFIDNDSPYIVFKEKVKICSVRIRHREEGNRNNIMFSQLSQLALLNPEKGDEFLSKIGWTINSNMNPRLPFNEFQTIVKSVIRKRNENTLTMYYNEEKRILFNPALKLTHKEKMKIVGSEMGNFRKNKTRAIIYLILEDWDFENCGKIKQKILAIKSGFSLSTIKKYWKEFRDYIDSLNQ